MIDFIFLGLITLAAILTPHESVYKRINLVLAAKFIIFIGLYEFLIGLGATGGMWEPIYRMGLDLSFAYLFYLVAGFYLSFLCVSMAIFHLLNTFTPFDYQTIMICFQVLQLMAASWGVIDGLIDRAYARFSGRSTHHPHHN